MTDRDLADLQRKAPIGDKGLVVWMDVGSMEGTRLARASAETVALLAFEVRQSRDALAAYRTREQQARALVAERRRGNEQRADDFGGLLRDLEAIYAKEAAS